MCGEESKSDPGASPIGVSDAEIFSSVSLFSSMQLRGDAPGVSSARLVWLQEAGTRGAFLLFH